ncbi:MAG: FAD-dependent oxidoreductase [Deltaproteobacteria bacterium]|nr:FAD-dependent oxidoreductase [Deltaproteobacteria bacterium]
MNDVLIMGGGFAGLAAATRLAADGRRVTLLEKRPVLGGRAYSYTDQATGEVIDNGQHAMMGCYTEMFRFLDRIGATDKLAIQPGLRVDMLDPERGAGAIRCPPLPNPLHMGAGVLGYRLLSLADRARVLAGGLRLLLMKRRGDSRLAERTVDGVLDLLGQSTAARRAFWHPVAVATLNDDPAVASADLLAEVMVRAFFAGKDAARFVLSKVGLSELYTHDARRFIETRGGRVETKAHVVGVGFRGGEVSHFELRDGRRLTASAYVSAVPPQGLFPLLPIAIRRSVPALGGIEGLTSSPIVSVHVWFDRPILAARPFVGFVGTETHWAFNRDVIAGRRDRDGGYLSFVISGARATVDDDNDAIVARTLADLRRLVPAAAAAVVRHTQVVKEKFATMAPTLASARLRPATVTPFDNFVLAGDWTDTGLPATIESAVMSGHRAADVVTARLAAFGTPRGEARAAS